MYTFEREALGIESLGGIQGGVTATGHVGVSAASSATWWITSFYSPDIWDTWRVGLVRGSVCIVASSPVALPVPITFEIPKHEGQLPDPPVGLPQRLLVCPAIVSGKALAFVVRDPAAPEGDRLADPGSHLELLAPTDLAARLELRENDPVSVRILPAQRFRAEKRPGR